MDCGWTVNTDGSAQFDDTAEQTKFLWIYSVKLGRLAFGWTLDARSVADGTWYFHVQGTRIRFYGTL